MTVESIIEPIVNAMTANGDSFTFLSASEWDQNQLADDLTLPIVLLTRPLEYEATILTGGRYRQRYICTVLFLYKDSFENTPEERGTIFEKATQAQREFHIRLDNDTSNVVRLDVENCKQVYHLFDADISGVLMPFSFEIKDNPSVCV